MGVSPHARRRGYGRALTSPRRRAPRAAMPERHAEREGPRRTALPQRGFTSLGLGMTWWLFPGRT